MTHEPAFPERKAPAFPNIRSDVIHIPATMGILLHDKAIQMTTDCTMSAFFSNIPLHYA